MDGGRVEVAIDAGSSEEDLAASDADVFAGDDAAGPVEDADIVDVVLPVDTGSDAPPPPLEAGTVGVDAGNEAGPPPASGPTCGPRGATMKCDASQVCCANLAAQTNACAATCAMNASLLCTTASDCSSSAPICCAHATLTPDSKNDPAPLCVATAFSASCAATCNDSPPANGCTFSGTVRLCGHDTDCKSDTANPLGAGSANQCWNYNGAPESWCTSATVGNVGGGVHQP